MPHPQELRPSGRITCTNQMLRAHEAFEAALQGDDVRYQTLLSWLDTRSLAWLRHLIETSGTDVPLPPPIASETTRQAR